MNKKYALFLLPLFAITLVAAAYLVSSFVITTDVMEPFTVEYAIIGDAGHYIPGVSETCDAYSGVWMAAENVDVGGLYAGESRLVCTKITNAGEGAVDYTFTGEVTSEDPICETIFGGLSVEGTVPGLETVYDGSEVIIAGDANVVEDCQITLSVNRG